MASKMIPIMSSPAHYHRSLVAYYGYTDRAEKTYKICSTKIPETVVTDLARDVDRFRYLGVGSGMGRSDIKLLVQLRKRYPKIKATIVEPSPAMISEFKENIIKEELGREDVEFEWKNMTLEDYMESESSKQKFHCMLLTTVMPYIQEPAAAMKYLYNTLATNGTIAIFNSSDNNVFTGMEQQYPSMYPGFKLVPTDKVVALFNDIGADARVFEMKAVVDITLCLHENSEVGNLMLDIFTHVVNFRETAPKDLVDDVLQFLQSPKLMSRKADDSLFIANNGHVIVIH
ncbi:histamine N-methyltransferase A-like [Glandiceps talaboti]